MTLIDELSPELRGRIELYAGMRSLPAEQVVEQAIECYIDDRPPAPAPPASSGPPVATRLKFKSPDMAGWSYGKMIEYFEDDLPLHKLR